MLQFGYTRRAKFMNSEMFEDLQAEDKKLQVVSQNFSGNWFEVGNVRENIRKQEKEGK
jgi:hypothetical protein